MKRIFALLTAICLLTGCATLDPYTPTGAGVPDASRPTQYEPPSTGQLRLPYNQYAGFHPYTASDVQNRNLLPLIYQGLFSYDNEYNVTPILCQSYTHSADLRTYTFYLEEAHFSNGQRMTALDVQESLRAAQKEGYYVGRFRHIQSIEATSDNSIVIKLDTPCGNLPLLLDIPIVMASQIEEEIPLGTGPYILEDTANGKQLRRQPAWWCNTDLAFNAQTIPLLHGTTQKELWDLYKFSGLSMVCTDAYVDFRGDYELWESETGMFLYLGCNTEKGIFSKSTIRSALTYAIDRELLVKEQYRGFAHSVTLPASPFFPYYSKTLAENYGYQPEKFAQAVADADLKDNSVVLLVNKSDSLRLRVALEIKSMLEAGGLVVTIPDVSGEDYLNTLKWEMYDLHLGQTKLSPNMDLTAFFDQEGSLCFGGMSNLAMNAMNKKAMENEGNYQSLYKLVMDDGRLCPILFQGNAIYGRRGMFRNLTPARDNIFYYSIGKTMEDCFAGNAL